ncbi:MAG: CS1 type fimbrial major subunit [Pseudomonas sp.]|uniref:CS1 type fimbrial major subunit n=1 Tax=Pseudomonas sp. TaxID=306 RepID=UPI003D6F87F4
MFKKVAMSAPVLALAFVSSAALAVPQTHNIQVVADIPSADFYVQPVSHDTVRDPQQLLWNNTTSQLEGISRDFRAKSSVATGTAPAIKATLLAPAVLSSGANEIELNVKFNNVALTVGSDVDVIAAGGAPSEIIVPLSIQPVEPSGKYQEGNYTGNVSVMFDAP